MSVVSSISEFYFFTVTGTRLAQEAWNRWIKEEGNVVDDITVIVMHLKCSGVLSLC